MTNAQRGGYKLAAERRSKKYRQDMDTFAEYLSRGFSVSAASAAMQIAYPTGSRILRRIREELGWQAQ